MKPSDLISIGQLADRTGVSVSAVRFYESRGLVSASRNAGGQRQFLRSDVRRISFVLIAQELGFSIQEIGEQLASLPQGRTPTQADWAQISARFGQVLDERIAALALMRDRLDGCIGCGCLSLKTCSLYNRDDRMAAKGPGPRYLLGDRRRKA
jgi:MerR family transcriptional regulator, redox-sensitive transcriptional activator SoxR